MRIPRNHNPSLTSVPNMDYQYLKNSLENKAARRLERQRFWLGVIALLVAIWVLGVIFQAVR